MNRIDIDQQLGRFNARPQPQVITSEAVLERFGFNLPALKLFYELIRGEAYGAPRFDNIKESYKQDLKDKKRVSPYGDIVLFINTKETRNKILTKTKRARDMSLMWQELFNILAKWVLDAFVYAIFPKHAHFILKKSKDFKDMPFEYMEFYIKAEHGNAGNVYTYFKEGDRETDSKLILPSGAWY